MEKWMIGPETFTSRFFLGSGKTAHYTKELIDSAVNRAGTEMISVAVRLPKECVSSRMRA